MHRISRECVEYPWRGGCRTPFATLCPQEILSMPRRATGPKYYPSRGDYYVTFQGKQHCLARGPLCLDCAEREKSGAMPACAACKKIRYNADLRFAELVHLAEVEKAEDNALVFALCNRYLKM